MSSSSASASASAPAATPGTFPRDIEIRLTKAVGDKHDKIVISPYILDADHYRIRVTFTFMKETSQLTLSTKGITAYLSSLFMMLARDTTPYRSVQMYIPGFPYTLHTVKDFAESEFATAIKDAVTMVITGWTP